MLTTRSVRVYLSYSAITYDGNFAASLGISYQWTRWGDFSGGHFGWAVELEDVAAQVLRVYTSPSIESFAM